MSIDKAIKSAVAPVRRALWRTIRRGIVRLSDAAMMLQIEGYENELTSDVEYWQHYGLASRPPAGTDVLTVQVGGETEHPIAIATHGVQGLPLEIGDEDVLLYNEDNVVYLHSGGNIDLGTTGHVHVGGDETVCTEPIIRGDEFISDLKTVMQAIASAEPGAAAAISAFLAKKENWKSNISFVEKRPAV